MARAFAVGLWVVLCLWLFGGLFGAALAPPARAELIIEITQGIANPVQIAVAPFRWSTQSSIAVDLAEVVAADLTRSGEFSLLPRGDTPAVPDTWEEASYRQWRELEMDFVLVGRVEPLQDGQVTVAFELHDVPRGEMVLQTIRQGQGTGARALAHRISDQVYETIRGVPGIFSTRLLYVTVRRGKRPFRLHVADVDGANERTVLISKSPIMSPAWSPDGKYFAYVSFENGRSQVMIQNLATGARRQVRFFKDRGINSSPAWSPDGRYLALVLSRDGNPDIYRLDLNANELVRLTSHFAIDTEPTWSPDGGSLLFTSGRSGSPQLYRMDMNTGAIERLTFEGNYNARGRYLPNGSSIVLVHRVQNGDFHIATMDLENRDLALLSRSDLDESPTVAPNGRLLLYATREGDRGVLAGTSTNGDARFRLPFVGGQVREPAWGPLIP